MRPVIQFSTDRQVRAALRYLPTNLTFGDVLQRLAMISPDDVRAIERMARAQLQIRWAERRWRQS